MITNYMPLIVAFDLAVICLLLGGGVGAAVFLFVSTKVVGNIIFTDGKIEENAG